MADKTIEDKIKDLKSKAKKEITDTGKKDKHGKSIKKATGETWRLVHNGIKVIALIEGKADTVTTTPHEVFIGTEAECRAEIARIGLEE